MVPIMTKCTVCITIANAAMSHACPFITILLVKCTYLSPADSRLYMLLLFLCQLNHPSRGFREGRLRPRTVATLCYYGTKLQNIPEFLMSAAGLYIRYCHIDFRISLRLTGSAESAPLDQ